jgi:hypothetical protein
MPNRYAVEIYRVDEFNFDDDAHIEWWRTTYGEDYLELVGRTTVEASDPRFAAALAYVRTFGRNCRAKLIELGAPPFILGHHSFSTIWRELRRTWHYSRGRDLQFHYVQQQPGLTCYFAVNDLSARRRRYRPYPLRRQWGEIPFSRN